MVKIMIVDDEEELLSLYGEMVTMLGHELIATSTNGEEALKTLYELEEDPDIIILDHRMPLKNGLETAKEILNIDPEKKIIFISADSSIRRPALEMGAVAFLDKPFPLQLFKNTIDNIVKNQG